MSNNLHNDHFTSTRSHQTLVMISWAHLSEEVASLYNFLSVCLWIQFSSDDQIGWSWRGASQDVELQWSVYLRYVCVSAEQCTVGDEGVIILCIFLPSCPRPAMLQSTHCKLHISDFDFWVNSTPFLCKIHYTVAIIIFWWPSIH